MQHVELLNPGEAARIHEASEELLEAARILNRDNPAVFSEEVDQKIRERFKDLVAGDAKWVE